MPRGRRYYVYIMASKSRVIYVGMTGHLITRVLRHKDWGGPAVMKVSAKAGFSPGLSPGSE